ncbi:pyridoxal phosphate-dependent aminotransferase [Streptomyces sp. DG2A-72]|uniref:pyridoxal phosphate-dependent aminotransferase n=1 Tax=Streptomyces sp. DG2A-72 TaxID=3051386 RepID=UPI00265C3A30|nr:pyridoxal phosphate-dependent aminotransferase [Streptomyces sp. DG2A-72]MDO0939376.1 pyridoxal phosphate-dependent aminotransferase [Streptomyces sp. DG2A-72]
MSATLAADEAVARRRREGRQVIAMTSGEIGLPVHPALRDRLAQAADGASYGPVAGSLALRTAAAGYWRRRGLDTDPDLVVCGPGSKPLLFALVLAVGGDVVIPTPSWVSYAAHARLAGVRPLSVPIVPGEGGVPDPELLREAVTAARAAGHDPRSVVVTLPDNPTGTVASPETVRRLGEAARDLDLVIISDEIYCDLVFDPSTEALSPARIAPERTVVTTGLTKNLAVGGWRLGVARLPDGALGRDLHSRLVKIASQIWSSPVAPVQEAAAYAFGEPEEIVERVAASRRLHGAIARAMAERFTAAGAVLTPVRATCYLYPDFGPLRTQLVRTHGVYTGPELARFLVERHGVGVIAASAFGESVAALRVRAATSRLYGDTDEERTAALAAADPTALPWIRSSLDRVEEVLADLAGPAFVAPPATAGGTPNAA